MPWSLVPCSCTFRSPGHWWTALCTQSTKPIHCSSCTTLGLHCDLTSYCSAENVVSKRSSGWTSHGHGKTARSLSHMAADCLAVYIYVYNMVRQLYIGLPFPGHSCLLLPWLAVKIKYLYLTRFSLLNVIIKGYFLFWNVNKLIYIAGCFIMLSFIFGRIHKLKQRGQCLAY